MFIETFEYMHLFKNMQNKMGLIASKCTNSQRFNASKKQAN